MYLFFHPLWNGRCKRFGQTALNSPSNIYGLVSPPSPIASDCSVACVFMQ